MVLLKQIDQITLFLFLRYQVGPYCFFAGSQILQYTVLFWFHVNYGPNLPKLGQYFLMNLRVHHLVSVEKPAANKANNITGKIIPIHLVGFLPYKSQIA